jgi:hypothetical protein
MAGFIPDLLAVFAVMVSLRLERFLSADLAPIHPFWSDVVWLFPGRGGS